MKQILYKDKKWLYKKYCCDMLSSTNISKTCHVTRRTILNWLVKYEIPRRSNLDSQLNRFKNKTYLNKKWLLNKYCNDLKSINTIAKECDIGIHGVFNSLKRHKISTRSSGYGAHLYYNNHCNLDKYAIEFITGEMLGDMHIEKTSNSAARITYGSKYKKYLNFLSKQLNSFGIKQSGRYTITKTINLPGNRKIKDKNRGTVYHYSSLSYPELLELCKKWYIPYKGYSKNNRRKWFKIIPRDLELTPLVCRQWFIGDGCTSKLRNDLYLATRGFKEKDVMFLAIKLSDKGFRITKQKYNDIRISCYSVEDFLTYIGQCPTKCYEYKWRMLNEKRKRLETSRSDKSVGQTV